MIYFWPFLWDEYFWSIQAAVFATSKEEAIKRVKQQIEGMFSARYKDRYLYEETLTNIFIQLDKREPEILDNNTCSIWETSR